MTAIHGWIIMDKPLGITSAGGVARVKRLMREAGIRKPKVGHGGTLDPLASGVLPIALGEATKLTGRMLNGDKSYDFTIAFGAATATDDLEGQVVAKSDARPTLEDIQAVLPRFTGLIEQQPPAYSALKVDGERAYKLARAGETVELAKREVTIHSLSISSPLVGEDQQSLLREASLAALGEGDGAKPAGMVPPPHQGPLGSKLLSSPVFSLQGRRLDTITLSATVSKGTYIRALARDIAQALGTVGHVSMLRRTVCGPFALENAITLDNLMESAMERGLESVVLPMTAGLDDIPALPVTAEEAGILKHGQQLIGRPEPDGLKIAMMEETPVALVAVESGIVRVERGLNL